MNQRIDGVTIDSVEGASGRPELRSGVFSCMPVLAVHDVIVALCIAMIEAWLADGYFFAGPGGLQKAFLAGSLLTPIAFFPTFHLYSYQLIFSRRHHLSGLAKAFALNLLAVGVFILSYRMSSILSSNLLILSAIGFTAAILVFSRFFSDRIAPLLNALGLACIMVGVWDQVGAGRDPLPLEQAPWIMTGFLAGAVALSATRYFLVHQLFYVKLRRHFRRQVLLIGTNRDAEHILNSIIALNAPFWIAGTVRTSQDCRMSTAVPKTQLGHIRDIEAILGENFFQDAIITDETITKSELIHLLDFLTQKGITVWFLPKLMPIIGMKLYIESLLGIPMIRLGSRRYQSLFRRVKYALDAVASLLGFIALLPLYAAAALAVKLTSAGPVFYRPWAVGKGGGRFRMYKFRSMFTGCSNDVHKDYVACLIKGEITPDGSGQALKITCDPRVTRAGRILRKTSLDEIPQLINVLKGEMSLVGPRPCLIYEYELYNDWHKRRTAVRPGITGLWQVVGRSEVSFEDMILLDLYYMYNRSLKLDISILLETLIVILKRKGAH